MRIGIDARLLDGRFTGDRTYWRGLIFGLSVVDQINEYVLYTREPLTSESVAGLPPNFHQSVLPSDSDRTWSLSTLPAAAKRDDIDVLHVQYSVSPFVTMPVVTTVHDITFKLFPEMFAIRDRALLNVTVPFSIARACAVIGVSQSTQRDILKAYPGTSDKKVVAIPLGAPTGFMPLDVQQMYQARKQLTERYNLGDGPYVLAVGVLQPRKNLPMLLNAFRTAKYLAKLPHRLVVAGKRGWLTDEIDRASKDAPSSEVLFTGYLPDEDLPLLYGCADLFCYPSLYEGFGLPPLEAMASGCPVLVSNTSSLPEVVGNAGVLIDPSNRGAWIDTIAAILTNSEQREAMRISGLAQASRFDWRQTASSTLEVYRTCHNRAKRRAN